MTYPKRLYSPDQGTEIEAHSPEQEAIYADSGWVEAPEPPESQPGRAAEPTEYVQGEDGKYHPAHLMAPEPEPEPETAPKPRRKAAAKPADEDS